MQIDIQWLQNNFARFNARYFSDLLPVPRFGVGHSRTRLGTLSYKRKTRMGRSQCSDFAIHLSNYYDQTEHQFQSVLLHEMIHLSIACSGVKDTAPHGVVFRGMMQRLNLARLLLINPDLLLLDEPSTGLDTESRLLLEQEIIAARERGACVVWVSHDAAHDAPLADNVLTIKNRELFKEELADTQLLSKREELC